MVKIILTSIISLILYSCLRPAYSPQEKAVRDKVLTGTIFVNSQPSIGGSIGIKNSEIEVKTNLDGVYKIYVNENDVLLFKFPRCKTQVIPVNGLDSINVFFKLDVNLIEPIMVR